MGGQKTRRERKIWVIITSFTHNPWHSPAPRYPMPIHAPPQCVCVCVFAVYICLTNTHCWGACSQHNIHTHTQAFPCKLKRGEEEEEEAGEGRRRKRHSPPHVWIPATKERWIKKIKAQWRQTGRCGLKEQTERDLPSLAES